MCIIYFNTIKKICKKNNTFALLSLFVICQKKKNTFVYF